MGLARTIDSNDSQQSIYDRPPDYESGQIDALDLSATSGACESLPQYNCSVALSAEFWLKHERSDPGHRAIDRSWEKVNVELRGTMLLLHPTHVPLSMILRSIFGKSKTVKGDKLTQPSRRYTLQGAQVGAATDYTKRLRCLRVRVEGEQLLLSAPSREKYLDWAEKLATAIDISLPLEKRKMPNYAASPRLCRVSRQLFRAIRDEPEPFTVKQTPEHPYNGMHHAAVTPSASETKAPAPAASEHIAVSCHSVRSGSLCACPCAQHARIEYVLFSLTRAPDTIMQQASDKWQPLHSYWSDALDMEYRQQLLSPLTYFTQWPHRWIVRDGHFVSIHGKQPNPT